MTRMPALFVGHGSPRNAIQENRYAIQWKAIAASLPRPKAILAISAHWFVPELAVTHHEHPPTIHDFGNFERALFDVQYPAPGDPALAEKVSELVSSVNGGENARLDTGWGLDHGTWSILRHMYPEADIPVVQLSIDNTKPSSYHYEIGQKLAPLRDEGILIFGSGNVVHNFAHLDFSGAGPAPWAIEFENWVKSVTEDSSVDRTNARAYPLSHWEEHKYGKEAQNSPDHFLPVLYTLGTATASEKVDWVQRDWDLGSFSMASFVVGA